MPTSTAPPPRKSSTPPPRVTAKRPPALLGWRSRWIMGPVLAGLLAGVSVVWWSAQDQSRWVTLQRILAPAPTTAPSVAPQSEAEGSVPATRSNQVALFFSSSQPSLKSRAVIRTLPHDTASTVERIRFALSQLLEGPAPAERQAGSLTEIPAGTRLLAVDEQGDAITVNLSPEFTQGAGATSVQRRVDELVKTVRAIETRRPVYLQIAGKSLQTLSGDGLEVEEPINQGPSSVGKISP